MALAALIFSIAATLGTPQRLDGGNARLTVKINTEDFDRLGGV